MKKLLLLASLVISGASYASATTSTIMDEPRPAVHNQRADFASRNNYTITNTTQVAQTYKVCYEITTCPEWPYYIKTSRACDTIDIPANQTRTGSKVFSHSVIYPIQGWCDVIGRTSVTGESSAHSEDKKRFPIY